ncbi:hypothetical protein NMYAN_80023 [Nitrosomonas nitrosa]|uniref:Uncharacterized protein n=1 Tax=Nitrosomonas nitrosa TaxID=52442 RepID=A0A8H8Z3P0_9PROT|nr:hypothetical protein NMYAN_80023 [Nitrosomonas nitrosa]
MWPDFPIHYVKENDYAPQMIEESNSIRLTFAAIAILGQLPS